MNRDHLGCRPALVGLCVALGWSLLCGETLAQEAGERETSGSDETLLFSLEPGLTFPLSEPQTRWFHPGLSGAAGVYGSLNPWVLLGARWRSSVFFEDDDPEDPRLAAKDAGGLHTLSGAVRFRPLAESDDVRRGSGLFLEIAGGAGITDDLVRGVLEPGAGYLFEAGRINVGPVVRYQHVIQPNGNLDDEDGRFLIVGAEMNLFDNEEAPPPPPREPEPEPEPEPAPIEGPTDECPDQEEDVDGFEDDDGCPDPDNDGDGIPDAIDDCPDEPETFNGVNDHDGCPDSGDIEVVKDRLVVDERVFFGYDKASLRDAAFEVLGDVASLWNEHESWVGIRVIGHADSRGTKDYNQELSEERAESVEQALTKMGLKDKRVEIMGQGETDPLIENATTEREHQLNRRVEFVVLRAEENVDDRPKADALDDVGDEPGEKQESEE